MWYKSSIRLRQAYAKNKNIDVLIIQNWKHNSNVLDGVALTVVASSSVGASVTSVSSPSSVVIPKIYTLLQMREWEWLHEY